MGDIYLEEELLSEEEKPKAKKAKKFWANEAGYNSDSEAFVPNKDSEDEDLSDAPSSDGEDLVSVSKELTKKKVAIHGKDCCMTYISI